MQWSGPKYFLNKWPLQRFIHVHKHHVVCVCVGGGLYCYGTIINNRWCNEARAEAELLSPSKVDYLDLCFLTKIGHLSVFSHYQSCGMSIFFSRSKKKMFPRNQKMQSPLNTTVTHCRNRSLLPWVLNKHLLTEVFTISLIIHDFNPFIILGYLERPL